MKRLLLAALLFCVVAPAQVTYKVQLTVNEGHRVVELSAETYVAAVLAGESSVFRSDEALKAMAVAARTYAAHMRGRHASEGFDFCATTHCQRVELQNITARLTAAAQATAGELLWFEGKPAFSVYTRDCGGRTENVQAVWPDVDAPYLTSRSDPYCTRHGATRWSWSARPDEITQALQQSHLQFPPGMRAITILKRTDSSRAKLLDLEGDGRPVAISASSFRFAIGRTLGWNTLRSDRYEIENGDTLIHFAGTGEGHGLGLCQHGADDMGAEGYAYRDILAFYYPGTTVALTGSGLNWVQMGGEGVTVFSTRPDRDRNVLALAEDLDRNLQQQLHVAAGRGIEIRVYPDIDTFRNATGEPGWIAARTSGSRIDLQPADMLQNRGNLRQTLRHELLHVLVESQAAPGLPVWFREGLVEWLNEPASVHAQGTAVNDADLRQRESAARAQTAYRQAKARVAELVNRYGDDVVLDWLKRGLPAEVTNSSASSAATKSK